MADRMATLASQVFGFLGMESVRDSKGLGITVSCWESEDAIRNGRSIRNTKLPKKPASKCGTQTMCFELPGPSEPTGRSPIKLTTHQR
jgi:hypothetical protein